MKTNSIHKFRRKFPGKAYHVQPPGGILRARAVPMSRHLRWSFAITERLAQRISWRGLHLEDMTLSLPARWILLRKVTGASSNSLTLVLPTPTTQHARTAADPLTHRLDRRQQELSSQPQIQRPYIADSTLLTVVQNRLHTITTATLSQQLCLRERRVKSIVREFLHAEDGSISYSPRLSSSIAHRSIRRQRAQAADFEPETIGIPAQVQRRHRRLEQRSFLSMRDVAPSPSPIEIAERPDVVRKPRPQTPPRAADEEAPAQSKLRNRPTRPDPPISIPQITDAVLQQLDRRLVAARERMGRI
jgi:hypothetical protein